MDPLRLSALVLALAAAAPVRALEGVVFDGGTGARGISPYNEGTATRLGLIWDWPWRWREGHTWEVSGHWELVLGTLSEDDSGEAGITEVVTAGITGMFRFARYRDDTGGPYFEVGVGPHYLSDTRLDGVDVSTHLQFCPTGGFGWRFGENGRYEAGYRIMHLSNAGIEHPNPGLNYHLLHLAYRY